MKKFIAIMAILFCASVAQAAPFLVCDPQSGVTHYQLTGPAWVPAQVTAQADGSLRTDVSASAIGLNQLTVKACKIDEIWGEQCSSAIPFDFDRPSAASTPQRTRLQK